MDEHDFTSLILYYGRAKFFHSMQKTALDGLAKYPANSSFRFYNGISLALGNRVQEGIRELNPLKNEPDLGLAAILGLIYAHKRCNLVDNDALAALEAKLKEERKNLSANSAYYAAVFLYLSGGKVDKAREYAEKAIKQNPDLLNAYVLKAWTEMSTEGRISKNILLSLEKVLNKGKNIDASLGQVRYFQLNSDYENAISVLNKLSVRFPELNIPLIEKMETQLASWNWDHAYETALRIINLEPTNIAALRVKGFLLICREGNVQAGAQTLQQLLNATEKVEMSNFSLILQICQLFSRICGRQKAILSITCKYVDKIVQMSPGNVEFLTELGYQNILAGNYKEATKCFRSATKVDDNLFFALCGLTLCQITEGGITEQVRQQIEFLNEIKGLNKEPILLLLSSKIAENGDQAVAKLIEATEIHFKNLKTLSFGAEYLLRFDPDFLLQVTAELMQHSPVQVQVKVGVNLSKDTLHISLKHCLNILEAVCKACPGSVKAIFMMAKVEFLCGEISSATATLQKILNDIDSTYTDAHLLISQIQIQQKQFSKALQSLEIGLSHNFSVRENPLYHLLIGIVQKNQQQYVEAQKSFLNAMNLTGSKFTSEAQESNVASPKRYRKSDIGSFTLADKVTLYLELIEVYIQLGEVYESERLLQNAMEEFGGTSEEGRLVIANADLVLQNGNVAKAIELLTDIKPGQSYYIQAMTHLANVYLHHRKDRVAFAKCFKQLVETCPEPESYLMLGEAYMSIQEPDLAVDAYIRALELNPNDSLLASKLGRAYVKTHQYKKAIKYYLEAVQNPDHSGLRLDLAELYLKLKQFKNAADILTEEVDKKRVDDDDISALQLRTKQLLLLARVHEKSGNIASSVLRLKEARDNQYRVQKRITIDQSGNVQEQNQVLVKICVLIAEQSISLRENDQAIKTFNESLKFSPNDIAILAALARLHLQMSQMEKCREICNQILHLESNNEAASVMMADLSFRKMDFENAAYHFSQLLISQPCYWTALARLIEVMRRSGTLSEVPSFLQRAESASASPSLIAGYNYCKGLFEWYCGNPNGALRFFNNARRDYEWGQQAIFNMIEICINPDGDLPNSSDTDGTDGGEFNESRIIALRTAERLLKELRPRPGGMDNETLNHRLLHNFLQLATKQKFQIESALQDFTDLASKEEYQNLVGPILGMASALIMLRQAQRAKNHLKRISRYEWNFEEAEYLERSWLLLADIYVQSNKFDVAESLVDKVLEHNKSCTKAFELAGFITEKLQNYREAAKNYNSAWVCGGKSKPHVGYKLAFNYMKIKKYADAIDVCQQVIKSHPDYTIIKKDILDKCRNNLRS